MSDDLTIFDKKVRVQIWDTAGQEKYRATTKTYYKMAHAIMLVYDVTNRKSFEAIKEWLYQIKMNTISTIKILLIGNKLDLEE